tara:strand:+ start:166 stop:309 length:144 start_codon:yes stop_codon:yes gene_type:complete
MSDLEIVKQLLEKHNFNPTEVILSQYKEIQRLEGIVNTAVLRALEKV